MSLSRPSLAGIVFVILASSCAPPIHYLGTTSTPTTQVKEYFDEKDIHAKYHVMGTMTNSQLIDYNVEHIREFMIRKAKEVGADAILYLPIEVDYDDEEGERTAVQAKLLKFD